MSEEINKEESNKLVEKIIEELYDSLMERPLRILNIFNDFFGEQLVDMQGFPDLEKFKSWINKTSICKYILSRDIINMSIDEWDTYKNLTIYELPISQMTKVANNLQTIMEHIGSTMFDGIFILVHFPHIRVTNEHDRFTDINHLWAKIKVSYNGTLKGNFTLNRSEYTLLHISSNYLHSHISDIPMNDFTCFKSPCLGTGPIKNTSITLNKDYDVDMWSMFCLELSKYITVESVSGTPYHYLEHLGTRDTTTVVSRFTTYILHRKLNIQFIDILKRFVKYFINERKLRFNYINGSYSIGMSLTEYIILISNEFISWYNDLFNKGKVRITIDALKKAGLLQEYIIHNNKIYKKTHVDNINNYLSHVGKKVCTFKGKDVTVTITNINKVINNNISTVLDIQTSLYILYIILKVLNYRYGRETNTTEENRPDSKVRYL